MGAIDAIEDDDKRRQTLGAVMAMAGSDNRLMPLRGRELAGLIDDLFAPRRERG